MSTIRAMKSKFSRTIIVNLERTITPDSINPISIGRWCNTIAKSSKLGCFSEEVNR